MRIVFTDYIAKLVPLKRFDRNKLEINLLLEKVSKIDWPTAHIDEIVYISTCLVFVSIVTNPHIILQNNDFRGVAVMKIMSLLRKDPIFAIDRSSISFMDSFDMLDENFDLTVLDPYQQECITLYHNLEYSNKIISFCEESGQDVKTVLSFIMTEIIRLYQSRMIAKMLNHASCFESIINQSLNAFKERIVEFENKQRVHRNAKKDLLDMKFIFEHVKLPFVATFRMVFSEFLDSSVLTDENYLHSLVEVLGGSINCNVNILKSSQSLLKTCKTGISLMGLLYLHNNLNYTQKGTFNASLHMGQLKQTIDGLDSIKSSRFYRPLFLRSMPKSWLSSNAHSGARPSFEMKRPRVELPPPAAPAVPELQFLKAPPVGLDQQNTPSPGQPPSLETGEAHKPIIFDENNCTAATTTIHQPIRREDSLSITDQKRTHATRYQRSQTVSIQNQVEYCVKDENSQKPNCAMEDEEDNFAEIDNMTIENMF